MTPIIVVMGVSGSGKSTLGAALAASLNAEFLEGDTFHPPENVEWMRAGHPLTDEMRWPWLTALATKAASLRETGTPVVISCSALKKAYRDHLRERAAPLRFLYLEVPAPLLEERMKGRKNHYMPPSLLTSQLQTLEVPGPDERDCTRLSGKKTKAQLLRAALQLDYSAGRV